MKCECGGDMKHHDKAVRIVIVAVVVGTAGIAFFVVFGDVIVCIAIIVFLIKLIFGRKKK